VTLNKTTIAGLADRRVPFLILFYATSTSPRYFEQNFRSVTSWVGQIGGNGLARIRMNASIIFSGYALIKIYRVKG